MGCNPQSFRCALRHEADKVAVCAAYLAGRCEKGDTCKLQHAARPELMPVCSYFLQGACAVPDCPYRHVKTTLDAPACQAFLRGHAPR